MRYLIFLLFISLVNTAFSQKMFEVQETICPLKFIMEDNDMLIYYEPNDSIMLVDLLAGLEQKHVDKLKGVLMLQVMVDTSHQVCCVSYSNKTNISDKRFSIPNRLSNMKGWKRLSDVFPDENISALISIVFDKEDYTIIRTGYNRNVGKNQLSYETFKRKEEIVVKDSTIIVN